MNVYIPSTAAEREEMLAFLGLDDAEGLYKSLPDGVKLKRTLELPEAKSELEAERFMRALADKNTRFSVCFRGAGAYNHFIPAIVGSVVGKEEFVTAYTPYQAEMSQGILQSIFEYQTAICEITGMDVSNAGVYDGASAAAEATTMCVERKRTVTLISETAHPDVIETVKTYCFGAGREVRMIPARAGVTDIGALRALLTDDVCCAYVQSPNFYGLIEDVEGCATAVHEGGAKLIMGANPMALALLKTPAECGADVAVGEAQPLGMPMSFGGPYLGYMACRSEMTRRLPGRIVGETHDDAGRRGYVLTLQAREQHIRREKASSNICSNQALCAMTASVYCAAMGREGISEAARQCHSKASYAAERIGAVKGYELIYDGEFFNEFVTGCPDVRILDILEAQGILGGYPVNGNLLWCVTELNTKEDIDRVAKILEAGVR